MRWQFGGSVLLGKKQNGGFYVGIFRMFLFGMRPDELAFKVQLLTSDLLIDMLNQILLTPFDSHCLTNFAKGFNLL